MVLADDHRLSSGTTCVMVTIEREPVIYHCFGSLSETQQLTIDKGI